MQILRTVKQRGIMIYILFLSMSVYIVSIFCLFFNYQEIYHFGILDRERLIFLQI